MTTDGACCAPVCSPFYNALPDQFPRRHQLTTPRAGELVGGWIVRLAGVSDLGGVPHLQAVCEADLS